ncbi:hypothetical protein IQ07DRAFT_591905 [Pyrenochaeta sp. DS3sAY3a]|nr:hypothetical protein IQ07DRAFT_591905 [Pyrenochaeta sp. DS3sAY3a]
MPLNLLPKKSWNVYSKENIARVKADEAAAAAREAADDERMQEYDAARRAALLRGQTPPPFPEPTSTNDATWKGDRHGRAHDGRRRKLAGEDDTDMDIRLAKTAGEEAAAGDTKMLKLRNTASDAPLQDHAGHINLFPVDEKTFKRQKNAEAEKEKERKAKAFEDQYTMRFSNAAGKEGLSKPWYSTSEQRQPAKEPKAAAAYDKFSTTNVWGEEDPGKKERSIARLNATDPLHLMQAGLAETARVDAARKKAAREQERQVREAQATQEREEKRIRHEKRKRAEYGELKESSKEEQRRGSRGERSSHRHRHHHHSGRSREEEEHKSSHRRDRRRTRSRSPDQGDGRHHDRHRDRDHDRHRDGRHSSRRTSRQDER